MLNNTLIGISILSLKARYRALCRLLRLRALISWRWLSDNPLQLVLVVLGVTIGVAAVIAVDAARQAIDRSFTAGPGMLQEQGSHRVTAASGRISFADYARLRGRFNAIAIVPRARFQMRLDNGEPVDAVAGDVLSELAWSEDMRRRFRDPADPGDAARPDPLRWLNGSARVLASEDLIEALDGDALVLHYRDQRHRLKVAGVLEAGSSPPRTILMDLSLAAHLRGTDSIDEILLRLEDSDVPAVRQALPPGLKLQPQRDDDTGMATAFSLNLQAMGLLALLMGVLLVYSTLRLFAMQRAGLYRLRHELGDARSARVLELAAEALALGLVGGVLGLVAGSALAGLVLNWVQQTLADLFAGGGAWLPGLDRRRLLLALGAGVGGSLLAVLLLLRRAHDMGQARAPLAAVTEASVRGRSVALWPALLLTLAAAAVLWLSRSLPAALGSLFALTLAWLLLSMRALPRLAALLRGRIPARRPLPALAAARLTAAAPRMQPALAALVLALATIVGVSGMSGSFRASVIDWLDITLSAPTYISNQGEQLPAGLRGRLAQLPYLDATGWLHRFDAGLDGLDIDVLLLDLPPAGQRSYRLLAGTSLWDGLENRVAGGPVPAIIGETLARRQQIDTGDTLQVHTDRGAVAVAVRGIFQDYRTGPGRLVALRNDWPAAPQRPTSLALYLPGQAFDILEQWLELNIETGAGAWLIRAAEIKRDTLRVFDRTFLLTRALRWIVALIALVGVAGALLALQLERRGELFLLQQLGLTGGEQRRLLFIEALLLALLALLLALPLGLLLGWLLTEYINLRAFGWHINWQFQPAHWLLMAAVGLGSAWIAAALAAHMNSRYLKHGYTHGLQHV